MSFDYIASPYTSDNPLVREERYIYTGFYVAQCLIKREFVFSPIVHCHQLAKTYNMPTEFDFWREYNFSMLAAAGRPRVLRLDQWNVSRGVETEIAFATERSIPVVYI